MKKRPRDIDADLPLSIDAADPHALATALQYAAHRETLQELEAEILKLPKEQAQKMLEILWETMRGPIAEVRAMDDDKHAMSMGRAAIEECTKKMMAVLDPGATAPPLPEPEPKPDAFDMTTADEDESVDAGRSLVRWMKETGFFTTAPSATTKDAGISALVVFETRAQMERNLSLLEGGPDLCWVGYQAPLKKSEEPLMNTPGQKILQILTGAVGEQRGHDGRPGITIVGQSPQGFLLREKGGEVFVEVIDPKQKDLGRRKRIPARTLDGGGIVHLLNKQGRKESETTLSMFVRQRERRRQKEEAVVIPNRSDHLARSIISTSGTKLHEEETRKTIEVLPAATGPGDDPLAPKKATTLTKWMAKANPAEAYEVTIGLLDASRQSVADLEDRERRKKRRDKARKTRAMVASTLPLPFDETKVEIVVGRAHQAAKDAISDQFFESIQRSLTPSLMQTLLAVFSQAYESGGTFVQNIDALLRLRGSEDGGFQRSKMLEELEVLGRLQFRLSMRTKDRKVGDTVAYRWIDYPILHRGIVKGRTEADGQQVVDSIKWWIDEDFLGTLQAHRHLAIIDRSLLALDAHREEWEFRLGLAISTRWSKGWLGTEHLSKSDGRTEWTVKRLVDTAGLGLNARNWIEKKGIEPFRDRLRQALEKLLRCGPGKAQAIGGFEIHKDRGGDPLLDRVVVWPTEGQVEEFRDRFLGRAEEKAKQNALEAAKKPKKARRRGRRPKA